MRGGEKNLKVLWVGAQRKKKYAGLFLVLLWFRESSERKKKNQAKKDIAGWRKRDGMEGGHGGKGGRGLGGENKRGSEGVGEKKRRTEKKVEKKNGVGGGTEI